MSVTFDLFRNGSTQPVSNGNVTSPRYPNASLPNKSNTLVRTPNADVVDIGTKKNNKKRNLKIALGTLVTAGVGVGIYALTKGKLGGKQVQQLAEHIEFKPAKTIEEAMEFGKTNLGIKGYQDFTKTDLDILNFVNEGLVNVSNTMKGKAKLPKKVIATSDSDIMVNYRMGVSKRSHELSVNMDYYRNFDKRFSKDVDGCYDSVIWQFEKGLDVPFLTKESSDLMYKSFKKFKSGKMSFNEKVEFEAFLRDFINIVERSKSNPLIEIENYLKVFPDFKNKIDLEKLRKGTIEEQRAFLSHLKEHKKLQYDFTEGNSPFSAIYHEVGHLNDPFFKQRPVTTDFHKNVYENYSKELKEWVDDKGKMHTARKVSEYAMHGPGEFIAETFDKLVRKSNLDDDVLELYKSLGGILP